MAMRMWSLAKLLIIVEIVIVFTNSIGMFSYNYYTADQGVGTKYTMGDIRELQTSARSVVMDTFDYGIGFVMAGLNMILTVLNIFFLLPSLSNTFKIPVQITAILQTMVYLEILWGFAQWKSGRPGAAYE